MNKSLLIIILLFFFANLLEAQSINANDKSIVQEEIFIHTDKPYYQGGGTLWFKLYVTEIDSHKPANNVRVAYIEVLDSNNNAVLESKVSIKNGFGNGSFVIPEDIVTGRYVIKTYTGGMRNLDLGSSFQKIITIVNPLQPIKEFSLISDQENGLHDSTQFRDIISEPSLTNKSIKDTKESKLFIDIHPDKFSYEKREKISVDLYTKDDKDRFIPADLSVSVYKADTIFNEDLSISAQVQNVFTPTENLSVRQSVPFIPFYGKAEEIYKLDEYTRFTSLEEVLREYVRSVGVGRTGARYRIFVYDELSHHPFDKTPFVLLDGIPVSDIDKLMAIDPLKIKTIEVVPRKYFFGNEIFYGIVNMKSYAGDMAGYEPENNYTAFEYESLEPERAFYFPSYQTSEQKSSRFPDFRSTLYWTHDLKTDASGRQHIEFYSSDIRGQFKVVVEGLTAEGKSGGRSETIIVH